MVIGFYLEHSAGKSLVKGDPLIYTYQGPGSYFVERTSDLNLGSRIPVEAIKKELEDLEPLFLKRLRYRNAYDELHCINAKGESVKKFRVLLLRGLTGNDQSLESRIMLEDNDFSKDDYERFKDRIYELRPTANSKPMARNSLEQWFTKNAGLQDWENFAVLASINPDFKPIYESYGKEEGYHAAYMMYVGVRRHIRARMERDKPFLELGRDKNKPLTKLQQEIDAIADMIFAEYDDYFKAAIITRIIPIETQEQWNRLAEKLGNSTVNVYTGKPRIKAYKEVNITDLLNTESVLKECWGETMYRYFDAVNNINLLWPKLQDKASLEISGYFVLRATELLVGMSTVETQLLYTPHSLIKRAFHDTGGEILNKGKQKMLDKILDVFMEDFRSGKAEEILRLPRYSLSDMANALGNVRSSIPRSYYDWEILECDITRIKAIQNPEEAVFRGRFSSIFTSDSKMERDLARDIRRELPKLEQKSKRIWGHLVNEYNIRQKKEFLQEVVEPLTIRGDIVSLLNSKMRAIQEGHIFFKKEDVTEILERFNLGVFIKYIRPRNFV